TPQRNVNSGIIQRGDDPAKGSPSGVRAPIPGEGRRRPERRCRMSAAALFTPGAGDFHVPVSVRLADLPRGQQLAAWRVYSAILPFLPRGHTELGERFTDRILRQSPWLRDYSRRFVQKGLRILTDLGIIRRIPHHGRRIIVVVGRLRGSDKPKPGAK